MTQASTASSPWEQGDESVSVWHQLITSPILWGSIATVCFYGVIPYSPIWRAEVTRYFAGHWIEYVTSLLSFIGLAILAQKAFRLTAESQAALWSGWTDLEAAPLGDVVCTAKLLKDKVRTSSTGWQSTHIAKRIQEVCAYLLGRRSAKGLEEHLRYLGELAASDLHSSYSLVRTVTWAVPILGFLGTVVGITDAIANLTPEQMEKSLSSVTAGLGTAFDTTALSLGWSMVIVFTTFFIERKEQRILGDVEEFGTRRLGVLFADEPTQVSPLVAAESQAADLLLKNAEKLVNSQMSLWQDSIEAMRQRWSQSLEQQQRQIEKALQHGLTQTLEHHVHQLAEVRANELHLEAFGQTVQAWQVNLQSVQATSQSLVTELNSQGRLLLKITEQEAGLHQLQAQLNTNLQAIRNAEAFEETLHTLNAAVHLLTNRTHLKAA
ncbi:MAG: MotA/TolQ/ExbB proton channel family protein [Planctomycetia bacterium]|nr:MotA/TolQ/ExbB proton channel family protein [Planctomycetia bacterium]